MIQIMNIGIYTSVLNCTINLLIDKNVFIRRWKELEVMPSPSIFDPRPNIAKGHPLTDLSTTLVGKFCLVF